MKLILAFVLLMASPAFGQSAPADAPAPQLGKIRNIAPEETWKRVTQCVFPIYPFTAFNAHITGTVDIAFLLSPGGTVVSGRVLEGDPSLSYPAEAAIPQWRFQPTVVRGETWSRIRALVRFNPDGTTAVDLVPAILADDFGDPGIPAARIPGAPPASRQTGTVSRPASAPECKSEQPWTGAQSKEIEASQITPGLYVNNYFGLTFHFPSDWQVADRDALDAREANEKRSAQSQYPAMPANVQITSLPSYLLFFARTDGPVTSMGPYVEIWAEKQPFIRSADQYFPNVNFLRDKTADGTSGPDEIEIGGTKYYRGDRWGNFGDKSVYEVRLVTYSRDLIMGIDVVADTAETAQQLVKKSIAAITIVPSH